MQTVLTITPATFLRRIGEAQRKQGAKEGGKPWSNLRTCREAGIGDTWLKDYRRRGGEKRSSAEKVIKLAGALEIPVSWLTEEYPEGLHMVRPIDPRRRETAERIAKELYDLCRQKYPHEKIAEFAENDCVDMIYDVLTESEEAGIKPTRRSGSFIALTIRRLLIARLLGELPN